MNPSHASAKRWATPPLVTASVGLHALAAGTAVWMPETAAWAMGAVMLNHGALAGAGLWPRSRWLGPNLSRLPPAATARQAYALTIDDGPDRKVTPHLLDLLDELGVRASFFLIAEQVRRQPGLARDIARRGHDIQNHSHSHRHHFSLLGPRGIEREVTQAQTILADITDQVPHCFRAPAGLRNPFLDPVLHRHGLHLVSWTRRGFDTRDGPVAPVLERLACGLAAGDVLQMHDGHAGRTAAGKALVLNLLPPLVARCHALGLHAETLRQAVAPRHGGLAS
ncbi:MAG: polysaccharide deacetylase family protein [Rubrivivax sp.]|nr:polysaccharide deacetylase family protein [Rubrivivax sp.]